MFVIAGRQALLNLTIAGLLATGVARAETSSANVGPTRLPGLGGDRPPAFEPAGPAPVILEAARQPIAAQPWEQISAQPAARSGRFDNLSVFLGLEGSKQPQDFGVNAQFGGRTSVNWGVPVVESLGIGAQLGTSLNATADAVQVVQRIEGSSGRTQNFTTLGLFQRADNGLIWGAAYDNLYENYYDSFNLSQWRLKSGYRLNPRNEVGTWAAISASSSSGHFGAIPVTLKPISQANLYYRHTWPSWTECTIWCGAAQGHNQVNVALGDLPRLGTQFVFGSELFIPLADKWALFGQGSFIMPASSGTVDAYLGFEFFPRGGAWLARQSRYAPVLPVAGSPTMALDLSR